MASVKGTDDMIGMPSWERFGRISGCAKSKVTLGRPDAIAASMAVATSAMVETVVLPTLISHTPQMRGHQSGISAASEPGVIEARWTLPEVSCSVRPAVGCLDVLNFLRSSGCSKALWYGSGDI